MLTENIKPRQAINKAFLKLKPTRIEVDLFKANLTQLLDRINGKESEEFHKNLVSDFLKRSYYHPQHFINTKGSTDLVIHTGDTAQSDVGVIIETKKPGNKTEMVSRENLNVKAFHELVLYYLRERIINQNTSIKYLIATNIYEWFIFDAVFFEQCFVQDKEFVQQFKDFEQGSLAGKTTDFFYNQIARTFIHKSNFLIEFTYFDIRNYEKYLRSKNPEDDKKLIALFKLFSPQHMLKLPFANDSNTLDKDFYEELLHIAGLTEVKRNNKKLIERQKEGNRHSGSLLENTIIQLDSLDKISCLSNSKQYGENKEEQLFNVALELCISWINRILFLKLLEAQLKAYNKGDKAFEFLNLNRLKNFDELNTLFFQVLARKPEDRNRHVKAEFEKIPYLNSSLFEPTDLEHATLFISNLHNSKNMPISPSTVLKDENGKRVSGEINTLAYFFRFLDAYDFSSEGSEEIQEENKTLINASVLGLIFEKINGYKDGSFFTPGFITMYMSRETIRKAVVQKFNEVKNWNCKNFSELKEDVNHWIKSSEQGRREVRKQANAVLSDIKICDPAVGSGHFLVSALNEVISIKSELNILVDEQLEPLNNYQIDIANDELVINNLDGDFFEYHPANKESQRVQETLFHEKQNIIENSLFGVDINPNSVKICRLRLWIELLKNAYYKNETQLETLPNIDINIKCGNSLISRFPLDTSLKKLAKKSKWSVFSYQNAVQAYKNSTDKEAKRKLKQLIEEIKSNYTKTIQFKNPVLQKYYKLKQEYDYKFPENGFFVNEPDQDYGGNQKKREQEKKRLSEKLKVLQEQVETEKSFFQRYNAFEWRFEFPEVLDENGNFKGFEVVIGNPPYGRYTGLKDDVKNYLKSKNIYGKTGDISEFFINMVASNLLSTNYNFSFIVPKGLSYVKSWQKTRELLMNKIYLHQVIDVGRAFKEAAYEMMVFVSNHVRHENIITGQLAKKSLNTQIMPLNLYKNKVFFFGMPKKYFSIIEKINKKSISVCDFYESWYGKGGMTPKVNKKGRGIKVLTGKEVQKYYIKDINEKWYIDSEFLSKKDLERAKCAKVVVQDIVAHITQPKPHIKLTAALDENNQFALNTVMCFKSKGLMSNEFLLALINSKLMSFYYYYFVFNQAIRTMHFMPGYTNKLPLPIPDNKLQNQIEKKVNRILALKKKSSSADTCQIEREIDELVYQLYGFNDNEIKIIEDNIIW